MRYEEFLKPTTGKNIAFAVLIVLAALIWFPMTDLMISLGVVGYALSGIAIIIDFPTVLLYSLFVGYKTIFFLLTLVYNYILVSLAAKLIKRYKPDWRLFIITFVLLEIIVYVIGLFIAWHALCSACLPGEICPACPSGNFSTVFLYFGIVPNLIIALIVSELLTFHFGKKRYLVLRMNPNV